MLNKNRVLSLALGLLMAAQASLAAPIQLQAPAPDFTLASSAGGNVRLAEQRGQVVLVNFWATWCGPCKVELPHLNRLHDKYKAAGVLLLGVAIDEDPKAATALATRMGLRFPTLLDSDKRVSKAWDLGSMPATVLIDRDGKVRQVHKGYRDGLEQVYDQQLRELVKE